MRRDVPILILFLLLVFLTAALGGAATLSSVDTWYAGLAKPSWTPPSSWFGPVWTVLYVVMAVAAWRVWRRRASVPVRAALASWAVQLLLNAAWSPLFFGLREPGWALLDIVLLVSVLAVTMIHFFRADRVAGWMMMPYLGWVGFATLLNAALWFMNRT